jgi:hypothetical protein
LSLAEIWSLKDFDTAAAISRTSLSITLEKCAATYWYSVGICKKKAWYASIRGLQNINRWWAIKAETFIINYNNMCKRKRLLTLQKNISNLNLKHFSSSSANINRWCVWMGFFIANIQILYDVCTCSSFMLQGGYYPCFA